MKAERLLALYEKVAEAPDAIARLRRFVLDLAVRGKLVPQDPADEPADQLLEHASIVRKGRIQTGELREAKGIRTPSRTEWLFDIPQNWSWSVADQLWDFENGDRSSNYPSRDQLVDDGIPFVNAGHLVNGRISLEEMNFITAEKFASLGGGKLRQGDQVYCLRGSLGKHAVFDLDRDAAIASSLVILRPVISDCVPYLSLYFDSDIAQTMLRRFDNGSAQPNLSSANLRKYEVPLPPLAEQRRIVAKVEELMALLDQMEAARQQREATRDRLTAASLARLTAHDSDAEAFRTHARFALNALPALTARPDQIKSLRQTILDLAVRGKLVRQDPTDEPASELLKRISVSQKKAFAEEGLKKRKPVLRLKREELPFNIPDSWELPSFDDLFVIVSGVTKGSRVSTDTAVELPYLRVANVQRGHLDLTVVKRIIVRGPDQERYRLRAGDILMTEGGDWDKLGRAAMWSNEIENCIHQNHIFRVRPPSPETLPEWVVMYVNSKLGRRFFEEASKQTTNLASINMTQLRSCPLPLPPLAEQHRIVAKVDALMALCDRLEAVLDSADTTRARLLEVLIADALNPELMQEMEAAE
ncbi:restriction endonuclease subunit S [Oceanibaculum indicum]|uniref:Restriction modification system DNA specificity subunit n=1 Tax=Oceanibaculum indicum P24 TaxID=1207063 RepID=K2IZR1_9PROT|nr:restriction endonuclease subunit S [Oceanibaculum indicum]EKE68383.1 restriction modification system DNA specificity subunit [Oceanibaculum indicum P24]